MTLPVVNSSTRAGEAAKTLTMPGVAKGLELVTSLNCTGQYEIYKPVELLTEGATYAVQTTELPVSSQDASVTNATLDVGTFSVGSEFYRVDAITEFRVERFGGFTATVDSDQHWFLGWEFYHSISRGPTLNLLPDTPGPEPCPSVRLHDVWGKQVAETAACMGGPGDAGGVDGSAGAAVDAGSGQAPNPSAGGAAGESPIEDDEALVPIAARSVVSESGGCSICSQGQSPGGLAWLLLVGAGLIGRRSRTPFRARRGWYVARLAQFTGALLVGTAGLLFGADALACGMWNFGRVELPVDGATNRPRNTPVVYWEGDNGPSLRSQLVSETASTVALDLVTRFEEDCGASYNIYQPAELLTPGATYTVERIQPDVEPGADVYGVTSQ